MVLAGGILMPYNTQAKAGSKTKTSNYVATKNEAMIVVKFAGENLKINDVELLNKIVEQHFCEKNESASHTIENDDVERIKQSLNTSFARPDELNELHADLMDLKKEGSIDDKDFDCLNTFLMNLTVNMETLTSAQSYDRDISMEQLNSLLDSTTEISKGLLPSCCIEQLPNILGSTEPGFEYPLYPLLQQAG